MKKCLVTLSMVVACCLSTAAVATDDTQATPQACYLPVHSNVAYSEVTSLAVGQPDAVIEYGSNPLQFGELWLPRNSEARVSPLVVFIHGGCWLNAYDIKHTHAFSTALSRAGYAVWSVEYRRTGDKGGGWPGSFDDIKAAIDFVPKLNHYPVDINKIVLTGHSAGGHLALLASTETREDLHAVIGLAAIVDIERYALGSNSCQTATPEFMGGLPSDKPTAYAAANPANKEWHPNTVLIQGDADTIVPPTQASDHSDSALLIEDAGHFDMIHPGTPSFQALLKELARQFP